MEAVAVDGDGWSARRNSSPSATRRLITFSSEDSYRIPGLEDALRRDLQMGVMEAVDLDDIQRRCTDADGTDADIAGLKTLADVVEKTLYASATR